MARTNDASVPFLKTDGRGKWGSPGMNDSGRGCASSFWDIFVFSSLLIPGSKRAKTTVSSVCTLSEYDSVCHIVLSTCIIHVKRT